MYLFAACSQRCSLVLDREPHHRRFTGPGLFSPLLCRGGCAQGRPASRPLPQSEPHAGFPSFRDRSLHSTSLTAKTQRPPGQAVCWPQSQAGHAPAPSCRTSLLSHHRRPPLGRRRRSCHRLRPPAICTAGQPAGGAPGTSRARPGRSTRRAADAAAAAPCKTAGDAAARRASGRSPLDLPPSPGETLTQPNRVRHRGAAMAYSEGPAPLPLQPGDVSPPRPRRRPGLPGRDARAGEMDPLTPPLASGPRHTHGAGPMTARPQSRCCRGRRPTGRRGGRRGGRRLGACSGRETRPAPPSASRVRTTNGRRRGRPPSLDAPPDSAERKQRGERRCSPMTGRSVPREGWKTSASSKNASSCLGRTQLR